MSKSSISSVAKPPLRQSAWAKGPPNSSAASSPRSQSPAPISPVITGANSAPTHQRRASQLSGNFKDGIGVSANANVSRGSTQGNKSGNSLSFGTVNDKSAPISSPPNETPPSSTKAETRPVQSFGSIETTSSTSAVTTNGKPQNALGSSSTNASSAGSSTASRQKARVDVGSLFRGTSSSSGAPSPVATSFSDSVTSPPMRTNTLSPAVSTHPGAHSSNQGPGPGQGAFTHPPPPFVPAAMRNQQGGPGGPVPRSPSFQRQVPNPQMNGAQSGLSTPGRPPGPPNAGNGAMPTAAGMPSPRLSAPPHQPHQQMHQVHPPHHQQHTPQPVPGMQMQPQWNGYYFQYMPQAGMPAAPGSEHFMQPFVPSWQMHHPQVHQPQMHPPPPQTPHGIPVSPRQPPPPLQPPGTPPAGIASPLPSGRLNTNASAFVPGQSNRQSRIKIKDASGHEVDVNELIRNKGASGASTPGTGPGSSAPSPVSVEKQQTRRPPIRMETEEAKQKRLKEEEERKRKEKAEEERKKKEKEEEERKAKEEVERKKKEEEERIKKAEEDKRRREEDERRKKEEEERKAKEEAERRLKEKEEQERLKKEEDERLRKEAEEKERLRKEEEEKERLRKEEEEKERLRKEEEEKERQRKEEELAKAKVEEEKAKAEASKSVPQPIPIAARAPKPSDSTPLSISPESRKQRPIPGPLDLSSANRPGLPQPLPSALATARHIQDLQQVPYPEGVKSPKPELNANAKDGKFRYDRDFLMQFMSICKEKPDNLPPLEAIGLEPSDQVHNITRGGSGRRPISNMGPPSSTIPRQASVGLGINVPQSGFKPGSGFAMGNFSTPNKLTSEERFMRSTSMGAGPGGLAFPGGRTSPMVRSSSQGGPGGMSSGSLHSKRTRSKRGEARNEANRNPQSSHMNPYNPNQLPLEPVAPLEQSANRWLPNSAKRQQGDENSPEVVDRKVRSLLNKLTMENFESISNQIIAWANKSENEKDGRTLIQVIRLVFEKATDEATWSEMYARLCRKMMEQISPNVQDDGIRNSENKPITGGLLFRKYLLNRCQEDFERGWSAKEATAAAAAAKASEDKAIAEQNEKDEKKDEEAALYSEEYYAAQKAKRQGLGLVKFIGELFKLQMLTERIMHECIKKLLSNVDNPEEEEIESLCKLLTTVGQALDTAKARGHMDVYFKRMRELADSSNVSSRMKFMLQDVIELRERRWIPRNAAAAPSTLAQVHETAMKEKAQAEKELLNRSVNMSRGGSRRGVDRNEAAQVGPDGWAVASGPSRPTNKAGDLSNFGKISKGGAMTFGPTSVFTKKDSKRESSSLSRPSSSTNMFSMLQNSDAAAEVVAPPTTSRSSRPPSRTASVDLGHGAPDATPAQRPKLNLLPRSKPVPEKSQSTSEGLEGEAESSSASMSKEQAQKKIEQDVKEFFAIRNFDEAEVYFSTLPIEHRHMLVDKLVTTAVESKEVDAKLVADFFDRTVSKNLCSPNSFEEGFAPTAEIIDDIAIDAPKAFQLFAMMLKGAKLDGERQQRIAAKSMDSEKLLKLLA